VEDHSIVDSQWQNAILTPAQVAEELSLEIGTVRDLMRKRILPATKVGGSWRTTRRALYGYLENQMGLESGVHAEWRKKPGKGVLQVQKRSKAVDKRRKKASNGEPEEVFFSR
jgi:excisionase family DNA binding protein